MKTGALFLFFFFQAEDGIRDHCVTGVQTCALPIYGHGTHVAGTVAQTTDNGIGVAGMAPLARLLPLKVLGADGSGTSVAIADAIRWAADHGARVLNLSLGGGARSAAMRSEEHT